MSKLKNEKMISQVEAFEKRRNKNETIIKDLVSSFLIPNIQRERIQKQSKIFLIKKY